MIDELRIALVVVGFLAGTALVAWGLLVAVREVGYQWRAGTNARDEEDCANDPADDMDVLEAAALQGALVSMPNATPEQVARFVFDVVEAVEAERERRNALPARPSPRGTGTEGGK